MQVFIFDGGVRIGFFQRIEKRLLQSRDDQRRFFLIACHGSVSWQLLSHRLLYGILCRFK